MTEQKTMIIRVSDTETTGLERHDEVVEIAAIDVTVGNARPAYFDSRLVRPTKPIPPEASAIHHITDEMVVGQPYWPDTWPHFFYPGGVENVVAVAAHKADYDGQWITAEVRKNLPLICTWKCAMRRWPDAPGYSNQCLRYWLRLNIDWSICSYSGASMDTHRAPADSLVTAYILIELLKDCAVEQLIAWSAEPPLMPTCPISDDWRGKPWSVVDPGFLNWCLTKKDMDPDIIWNVKRELLRRVDAEVAAVIAKRDAYVAAALPLIEQAVTVEDLRCWFAWEAKTRTELGIYPGSDQYKTLVSACADKSATLPPAIPIPQPEAARAQA